jgi:hypothetical protein
MVEARIESCNVVTLARQFFLRHGTSPIPARYSTRGMPGGCRGRVSGG